MGEQGAGWTSAFSRYLRAGHSLHSRPWLSSARQASCLSLGVSVCKTGRSYQPLGALGRDRISLQCPSLARGPAQGSTEKVLDDRLGGKEREEGWLEGEPARLCPVLTSGRNYHRGRNLPAQCHPGWLAVGRRMWA